MPVPLMRETHMFENYIHYVFAFEFNHVGFINNYYFICTSVTYYLYMCYVPVTYDDAIDMKYPSIFPNNYREVCVAGAMCFVGKWNKIIRSSKNNKLYWIGNINNVPPNGNSPRYPLQIVEVDEKNPSFIKETVTVIDDRNPSRDSEFLQLSNFSLLENRETNNMELYLTRLGENGGGPEIWTANSYKYFLYF